MKDNRLEKEKAFHDNRFDGEDKLRINVKKYYSVNKNLTERYIDTISRYCKGKKLLEFGCGTGQNTEKWLNLCAQFTGIDISPKGIEKARLNAANYKYKSNFFVMNAENTEFENNSFDIIIGSGIIHHLDITNAYKEINRILNNNGHAVFLEPLGHNPIINLYRFFTPNLRTEDEHPLKIKNIKLLKNYFQDVKIEYFSLFTLLAVPFRNKSIFNSFYRFLSTIDNILFHIPFFKRYAWSVLIDISNPMK